MYWYELIMTSALTPTPPTACEHDPATCELQHSAPAGDGVEPPQFMKQVDGGTKFLSNDRERDGNSISARNQWQCGTHHPKGHAEPVVNFHGRWHTDGPTAISGDKLVEYTVVHCGTRAASNSCTLELIPDVTADVCEAVPASSGGIMTAAFVANADEVAHAADCTDISAIMRTPKTYTQKNKNVLTPGAVERQHIASDCA